MQLIPGRSVLRNKEAEDDLANVQLAQVPEVLASLPTFDTTEASAECNTFAYGALPLNELVELIDNPQIGLPGPDLSGTSRYDYAVAAPLDSIQYEPAGSISNTHSNFWPQPAEMNHLPPEIGRSLDWEYTGNSQPHKQYQYPSFSGDPGNSYSSSTYTSQPCPSRAVHNVDQGQIVAGVPRSDDSYQVLKALPAYPENCEFCGTSFEKLRELLRHLATGCDPKAKHKELVRLADEVINVPCLIEGCSLRSRGDSLSRHLNASARATTSARGLHSHQQLVAFHRRRENTPLPRGSVKEQARAVRTIMTRFQSPKRDQAMRQLAHYWANLGYDVTRAEYGLGKAAAMEGITRFDQASNALGEIDDADPDPDWEAVSEDCSVGDDFDYPAF